MGRDRVVLATPPRLRFECRLGGRGWGRGCGRGPGSGAGLSRLHERPQPKQVAVDDVTMFGWHGDFLPPQQHCEGGTVKVAISDTSHLPSGEELRGGGGGRDAVRGEGVMW